MYHQLAALYDSVGAQEFPEKMLEKTLDIFEAENLRPPGRILDAGCGSGTLALNLAHRGWEVTGLDLSDAMLEIAREKERKNPPSIPVKWLEGDLCDFLLPEPVAVATCYCNVFNHLASLQDLRDAFAALYANLEPGGRFLFDLDTLATFTRYWDQGLLELKQDDVRIIRETYFDTVSGTAEFTTTMEVTRDDGEIVHVQEAVDLKYFSEADAERALRDAGFVDISWTPFNPIEELFPGSDDLKTFWRCQKPQ